MHIPKGTTDQLELVTFRQALEAANTPSPDYDIGKWLYAPNFYSEYRYILGTRGNNPLICIGINPSTAEPDNLDNTLKSVERIALGNGFDSFIMFNVYAQRPPIRTLWKKYATPCSTGRIWKRSGMCCLLHKSPPFGQPGAPLLKRGPIFRTVFGICFPWGRNTMPDGSAPAPLQKKGTPTTRYI